MDCLVLFVLPKTEKGEGEEEEGDDGKKEVVRESL